MLLIFALDGRMDGHGFKKASLIIGIGIFKNISIRPKPTVIAKLNELCNFRH